MKTAIAIIGDYAPAFAPHLTTKASSHTMEMLASVSPASSRMGTTAPAANPTSNGSVPSQLGKNAPSTYLNARSLVNWIET